MWIRFSELDSKARANLPKGKFAYVDAKGGKHLPIHDANHVRAALGRLNQTQDADGNLLSPSEKTAALAKIRAAASRLGVDSKAAKEFAEAPPSYGPGGDDDWDDGEEPDESEDDTRPGDSKKKQADDSSGGAPGGMGLGDVHVPAPVNTEPKTKKKKSIALKSLTQAVRSHFASGRVLGSDQFESMFRKSIGKAGGVAKKSAGEGTQNDNDEDDAEDEKLQEGELHTHSEGSPHFVGPDGTGYRMFLPFQMGEWLEYLPGPGNWTSDRYGKIEITAERNEDFVKKFNDGVYQKQIPIDAEHQTKLSGAMGWIEQMRLRPDHAVEAYVGWTPRGETMLAEKAFKYFSPEWYDAWRDPATNELIENVAIGGALTTRPFFKESSLEPLVASERGFQTVTSDDNEELGTMADDPKATKTTETKAMTEEQLAIKLSEAEATVKQFTEQLAEANKATETARAEVVAKEAESKKMTERIEAIERRDRVARFTEIAKDFPGETAAHVAILDALPNEPITAGEGKDALPSLREQYITTQKAAAEQLAASNLFRAYGSTQRGETAGDALAKVVQAAEARVKADTTGKLTLARAAAETWTDESYAAYLAETGN